MLADPSKKPSSPPPEGSAQEPGGQEPGGQEPGGQEPGGQYEEGGKVGATTRRGLGGVVPPATRPAEPSVAPSGVVATPSDGPASPTEELLRELATHARGDDLA